VEVTIWLFNWKLGYGQWRKIMLVKSTSSYRDGLS